MVSALWKASSEGDLDNVLEFLKSATSIDIEIKDHTGATPLIEAVKNGHTEIVRVLLDHGADPSNASSQGLPEQFTSDQAILELIRNAQNKINQNIVAQAEYPHDPNADPSKQYYPPPGAYYYPGVAPLPEGAVAYYPPMPPQSAPGEHTNGNGSNLPPPEIARMIPCRYYPACRYGASCMFAHPQGPYFPGPLPPPAQYPTPYDPAMSYQPNYYAVVPPSFSPPNGVPMSPTSPQAGHQHTPPQPHMGHSRSSSEIVPPPQGQFSPPIVPYGAVSPLSPGYPHPGAVPIPVSIPSLPPLNHSVPPPSGAQSPPAMYQNVPPPASFAVRPDSMVQFPPPQGPPPVPDQNGGPKSPTMQPQTDGYHQPLMHREGMTHYRRGSMRKPSFGGSRKPPCLFFPAGRCRNGDECRFPHVLPDNNGPQVYPHFPSPMPRGPPRPRHLSNAAGGIPSIEEKMAGMTVREDATNQMGRSLSSDTNNRMRLMNGARLPPGGPPPPRVDKRVGLKQRLPSADEFPALAGSTTPPKQSPGLNSPNGYGFQGPTAAQVLQAPAPARKDTSRESLSSNSSEQGRPTPSEKVNLNLSFLRHLRTDDGT
ncbi:hypothetical protein NEOLEDRAFT_1083068 [Neolentinus lepideus HHB14362 ss-1]|uniref:C3H1-type domain-containing protein n=1 Tax=Neolentinus lepideus HHB14362 ss-1 TaxID=1314782 RepID=A0A165W6B8_9AGAM|nr:hypothetical protein NEOLEDRAFT_1083068 [Neolentinus lepideus HHB14362 ss-1]